MVLRRTGVTDLGRIRQWARSAAAWLLLPGLLLVAACVDQAEESPAADTTRPEPDTEPDTEPDPGLESVDVRMRDPLRSPGTNFPEEDFGGGNRIAYTGDAFRVSALRRPVVSPLQDRGMARLVSAEASVELTTVSGFGSAGLVCGVDREGGYVLGVIRGPDGATQVAISYYDRVTGLPDGPDPSPGNNPLRDVDLPPRGQPVTIGAVCRPGDGPDDARLTMTLDGHQVLDVTHDKGPPTGQVGMFNWGAQSASEPLVTDFANFAAAGTFR